MMTDDPPPTADLPPSAQYVYHVLEEDGPLARQKLRERVALSESTFEWAVDHLNNCGYLSKTRKDGDLRQVVYNIRGGPGSY